MRINGEGPGHRLGFCVADGLQIAVGLVHPIAGHRVVAPVGRIQEPSGRVNLNLSAGIGPCVAYWQGGNRLEGSQSSLGRVKVIRGYAAPLLVGKVENVSVGVEAVVPGSNPALR